MSLLNSLESTKKRDGFPNKPHNTGWEGGPLKPQCYGENITDSVINHGVIRSITAVSLF